MALINGTDDGALLIEDDAGEWRARLTELRELRQAHLYEYELLAKTNPEPPRDSIALLMSNHGQAAEAISQEIAQLLQDAAQAADDD